MTDKLTHWVRQTGQNPNLILTSHQTAVLWLRINSFYTKTSVYIIDPTSQSGRFPAKIADSG